MGQKEHCNEQSANDPGTAFHFLEITTENADDNIGNQAESDTVGDIVCKGHHSQSQEGGNCNSQIVPVDIFTDTSIRKPT